MAKTIKGYLVIDDISREEAIKLMEDLKKKGRWLSARNMGRNDSAAAFAITTHGFAPLVPEEIENF